MEPAAIRYKNPGAMWPNAIATKWGSKRWIYLNDGTGQGGSGKGNKIAIFETWSDGIAAQLDLWRSSANYKNKRFADAIAIWSGHNNVPSYIAYVKARVPGMTENTIMNDAFWASPSGILFLKAQSHHEAGKELPATDADWRDGQRRVMSGKQPATPTKKTAATAIVVNTTTTTVAVQAAHSGVNPLWVLLVIAAGIGLTVLAAWFFHSSKEEVE